MKMIGKFKVLDYDFALEEIEGFKINTEDFSCAVEVKFKNARIEYHEWFNKKDGRDRNIVFIARDNATLKRLQKFVQSDLFVDILERKLGKSGTFECNL